MHCTGKLTVITLLVGLFSISGCSLFEGKVGGGGGSYVGTISFGFEEAAFRPCDRNEQWWITGGDAVAELQTAYNDLGVNWYEPAYARLKGAPSSTGEFGHLGAYQREFNVKEIVAVRVLEEGECVR